MPATQTFRQWELHKLVSAPQPPYARYKGLALPSKPRKHAAPGDLVQRLKPPGAGWVRAWTFVRPHAYRAPRCPAYRSPVWGFDPDKYAEKLEAYQASVGDGGTENGGST